MARRIGRTGVGRLAVATAVGMVMWAATPALAANETGPPDIVVEKASDTTGPVEPGDQIVYTIIVSNVGRGTAHDVTVNDELPPGVHPVGGVPDLSGADGFCTAAGSVGPNGQEHYSIYCEIEELSEGAQATITVTVKVDADAPCGDLTNVVHAEADDEPGDHIDEDNDAEVTDEVDCRCGVAIAKTVAPASGNPGDQVTYTYVVSNTGNTGLVDVTVDDDQLGPVGSIPSLDVGDDATLQMSTTLPSQGDVVTNVATVSAATEDDERCTATDDAVVTIVSAGGGGNPPPDDDGGEQPPGGGTAFTGPADLPAGIAALLLIGGIGALTVARRRSAVGGR